MSIKSLSAPAHKNYLPCGHQQVPLQKVDRKHFEGQKLPSREVLGPAKQGTRRQATPSCLVALWFWGNGLNRLTNSRAFQNRLRNAEKNMEQTSIELQHTWNEHIKTFQSGSCTRPLHCMSSSVGCICRIAPAGLRARAHIFAILSIVHMRRIFPTTKNTDNSTKLPGRILRWKHMYMFRLWGLWVRI